MAVAAPTRDKGLPVVISDFLRGKADELSNYDQLSDQLELMTRQVWETVWVMAKMGEPAPAAADHEYCAACVQIVEKQLAECQKRGGFKKYRELVLKSRKEESSAESDSDVSDVEGDGGAAAGGAGLGQLSVEQLTALVKRAVAEQAKADNVAAWAAPEPEEGLAAALKRVLETSEEDTDKEEEPEGTWAPANYQRLTAKAGCRWARRVRRVARQLLSEANLLPIRVQEGEKPTEGERVAELAFDPRHVAVMNYLKEQEPADLAARRYGPKLLQLAARATLGKGKDGEKPPKYGIELKLADVEELACNQVELEKPSSAWRALVYAAMGYGAGTQDAARLAIIPWQVDVSKMLQYRVHPAHVLHGGRGVSAEIWQGIAQQAIDLIARGVIPVENPRASAVAIVVAYLRVIDVANVTGHSPISDQERELYIRNVLVHGRLRGQDPRSGLVERYSSNLREARASGAGRKRSTPATPRKEPGGGKSQKPVAISRPSATGKSPGAAAGSDNPSE